MRHWISCCLFCWAGAACSATDIDLAAGREPELIACEDDLRAMLALINAQRVQPQICAGEKLAPVAAITWNKALAVAAQEHSTNMADNDFFDHRGPEGDTAGRRVSEQGYTWSFVAENIAAGQTSAQSVIAQWMASARHCRNIMSEAASQMGIACVADSDARYHYYWTQVFAAP